MDQRHITIRLPVEITDMIIDFLFDDSRALSAMSLACKAFIRSARLHLFERVTLTVDYPYRAELVQTQFEELTHIFVPLAPLVHQLNILAPHSYLIDDMKDTNEWLKAAFPLFAVLRGVTSLSIELSSWIRIETEVRRGAFACFSSLLELSLAKGSFHDTVDIIDSITQTPTLERLWLNNIGWLVDSIRFNPPLIAPSARRAFSNIRSFAMGGDRLAKEPILSWILSLDTVPPLHTLQITSIHWDEREPASRFLRALGPALRHLVLGFESIEASIPRWFYLGHNSELRSLHLIDGYPNGDVRAGSYFLGLLSQVIFLEELSITTFTATNVHPEVWLEIDQLLDQPRFSDLRQFSIYLDEACRSIDAPDIEEMLVSCAARGILRFF